MNTTRLAKLILCAALIVAILVALQTFKLSANSKANVPAYTGRGDYQRYEAQFFPTYTGRGDYQRYESQFFPTYTGRGDYQRYEAQFFPPYNGALVGNR
jgi:hypothetical protein